MLVVLHIVAGGLALLAGSISFATKKGAPVHRKAGQVFIVSMVFMSLSGAWLALLNNELLNIVAGLVTFYLVCTAFIAARSKTLKLSLNNLLLALFGFTVGTFALSKGYLLLSQGISEVDGNPTQVMIVFGAIALLAALADAYHLKVQKLSYKARLIRHSWRVGIAMFFATASFFLGQAQVFPEALRVPMLLVPPVLLSLLLTAYWVIRVKFWGLNQRV